MFEQAYRRRIEADLSRWQGDGTISADAAAAIRANLGPVPRGAGPATIVGIVGGLLIVAAVMAFVAANWPMIPRLVRLALLVGGIVAAHAIGALFARHDHHHLADAGATFGAIVFGSAVALVGQMYHLPSDFAAGFLLWSIGALAGAILTGARGALAVALVAGGAWSVATAFDLNINPHWPALALWAVAAGLAVHWNSPSARHLAALFLVAWWIETALGFDLDDWPGDVAYVAAVGAALMLGLGLAIETVAHSGLRRLGGTHATYGALGLAFAVALCVIGLAGLAPGDAPVWSLGCALGGAVAAVIAAVLARRAGPALAAIAILLALATAFAPDGEDARWIIYGLSLASMLALLLAGAVDGSRARLVAGWIGLGLTIAAITWRVEGGLIDRALFLAAAGAVAVLIAWALGRLSPEGKG